MKISAVLAALLSATTAFGQTRAAAPRIGLPSVALVAAPVPAFSMTPALALSAPLAPAAALAGPVPALMQPALAAAVPLPLPARITALTAGVAKAAAALGDNPSAADSHAAGRDVEALLTGAAQEELAYVLGASPSLAARADELGADKGLKAATMGGGDFLALIDEARAAAPPAPTPAAATAAREIEGALARVARALIPADKPLAENVRRALAVWQVFDQELALAAAKGTLAEVVADAVLFATQVEASVDSPKANHHPEDPNGYAEIAVPGSIFGWKPIEDSPGHGVPPLDALIRYALAEKKSSYAKGFELPGAAKHEDARVYFYGERHTDGELISANMKRLVEDARPGKPMIVLVEGYTGWSLRGWEAVKYLSDRGLDPDALTSKNIASGEIEVRGWDISTNYDASKHPMLQQHMDKLTLNHLAHGELRGWRYYRELRAALVVLRGYLTMWQAVIDVRNGDLDRAVAEAAANADASGATLHVIAGTDHLMQNPRLVGLPLIGRPSMRRSLRDALGGRRYWASQPPNTIP